MAPSDADDFYTDPATGVLRNLLGLDDAKTLNEAERRFTYARRLELADAPVPQTFDIAHLQAIHRHIFQDVYPWAGELRTVNISKGRSHFHPASGMATAIDYTFTKLHNSGLIDGGALDDETFERLAAELLADVNYMHPFREGNGRTQRIFLDDVAARSGRTLAWRNVSKEENIFASEQAHHAGSGAPFVDLFHRICRPPADARSLLSGDTYVVTSDRCGATTSRGVPCRRRGACPYHQAS